MAEKKTTKTGAKAPAKKTAAKTTATKSNTVKAAPKTVEQPVKT